MLSITIMRGDNGQEAALKFPGSFNESEGTLSALEAICSRDITTAIISADTSTESPDRILPGMEVDGQELNESGFFSRRVGGLRDRGRDILIGILELELSKGLRDIVNLSHNLHKFERLPGVKDADAMGRHLLKERGIDVPGNIVDYIAYDQMVDRYLADHPGVFTDSGFVFKKGEPLEIIYDGEKLPGPYCNPDGTITVQPSHEGESNRITLTFPATEECIRAVLTELDVKGLEDCYTSCTGSILGLLEHLPNHDGLECLNLGAAYMGVLEEQYRLPMAVMEAEVPGSTFELPEIVDALCQYHLPPEDIEASEDYAEYLMDEGGICYVDRIATEFVNFDALGKAMVKENGVVLTSFGIVERYDHPIRQLPEKLTMFRLPSPLYTQISIRDKYGDLNWEPEEMSAHEVYDYWEEILRATADRRIDSESDRGPAAYLKNELSARKVYNMNPTVEAWDDGLRGVLEVQVRGESSEGELQELTEAWSGQCSDGWGEGPEQQEIKIDQEELHVSFWHSGGNFVILTEAELKNQTEQQNGIIMQ